MCMNFMENVYSFEILILEETLSTWIERKKEKSSVKTHREDKCHVETEVIGLTYLQDDQSENLSAANQCQEDRKPNLKTSEVPRPGSVL